VFSESIPGGTIVVPEYAYELCVESRESFKDTGLSDVAGMDDPFDARVCKELDDFVHVAELVVSVADDADAHQAILTRRASGI
jgi:hypothetical protein